MAERPIPCPVCGQVNEQHDTRSGRAPRPGDAGMCWTCGSLLVFTEEGQRLPTAAEAVKYLRNPRVQELIVAWLARTPPQWAVKRARP